MVILPYWVFDGQFFSYYSFKSIGDKGRVPFTALVLVAMLMVLFAWEPMGRFSSLHYIFRCRAWLTLVEGGLAMAITQADIDEELLVLYKKIGHR